MGGTLRATQMNGDRMRAYFRQRRKVESAGVLETITREGVPAEVEAGGNMRKELAFGNYRSALQNWGEVPKKKKKKKIYI